MSGLLGIVAVKAGVAVVLALGVALAGRRIRQPAVVHALWVVVLLQFLVPPVLEVGVLPRSDRAASASAAPAAPLTTQPTGAVPVAVRDPATSFPPSSALTTVWLVGAAGVLLLAAVRMTRFRRSLAHAGDAPASLAAAAAGLARRMGLSRVPRIRIVPARISPMLRCRLGPPEMLFPAALLERLSRPERETLVAHELAHVQRRDHWVRYLELITVALFWWHPVVWWARSRLREAEELCCDAIVLRTLPGRRRDYAAGLVKTVEFLAGVRRRVPVLASGVGRGSQLKERLTMIVKHRSPRGLSLAQKLSLSAGALAVALVFPTWADPSPGESGTEPDYEEATEARFRRDMVELEQRAADLEHQLREVRLQQKDLEMSMRHRQQKAELERMQGEAERVAAEGQRNAAERLKRREQEFREQMELDERQADLEREMLRRRLELEMPLRQTLLELGVLESEQAARRAELESRAARIRAEFETMERSMLERRAELDRAKASGEMDRLRREVDRLRASGREREAEQIERELDRFRDSVAEPDYGAHLDRLRRKEQELEALRAEQAELEAEGREPQREELEQEIRRLKRELEELRDGGAR